jgi:phosphoglycerol transferase
MNTLQDRKWPLLLAAAMLTTLAFLLVRHYGLHPFVFYDELAYSTFSRLAPRAESVLPSWLYLWIFGATSACGPAYLECARGINALFFVASAPLVYQCALTVTTRPAAALIAVFSLLAPVNSYTAYFMPEAMYYFMFWLVSWVLLARLAMPWLAHALLAGVLMGLMATVKVHALFMLPSIALFLAFRHWQAGGAWVVPALGSMAAALASAMAVKFGLGYLLAGDAGLTLFGTMYGAHASGNSAMLMQKLGEALLNARGHLMGLALLFAFPFALAGYHLLAREERAQLPPPLKRLLVYAALALAAPLGVTILYTASIYAIEGTRIHTRYYDFTFPLLCMVGAATLAQGVKGARLLRLAVAGAMAIAVVVAALYLGKLFSLSFVDNPELKAMKPAVIGAASLLLLALWAADRRRLAQQAFVFVFLPLYLVHTLPRMNDFLQSAQQPSAFDSAGKYAHAALAPGERAGLAIAGTGLAHLMRAKFHVDDNGVKLIELPAGAALAATAIPVRSKWVLVVGDHALPADAEVVKRDPAFVLMKRVRAHQPLFKMEFGAAHGISPALHSFAGLGDAEQWGRWSTAKEVVLLLKEPLPPAVNLVITAQSFGPNVHQPIRVRVGQQERSFSTPATPQEVLLEFDNPGAEREIVITVPQPASPKLLGLSPDVRMLGVGLVGVEVGTR